MLNKHQAKAKPPILLVHGGAGSYAHRQELLALRCQHIADTIQEIWPQLLQGTPAIDVVTRAVERLESCPDFNAGRGAVIQSDGLARLSASLMDGVQQKFSGVMLATHLINPSKLAYALQHREESVLGPLGAQLLARELGIPPQSPITLQQAERWIKSLQGDDTHEDQHGTVGAVALDANRNLAAATSTGGSKVNSPHRISDSATVAGNYASRHAAISCTGIGEQIVDDGVAVRLETRVRDGQSLIGASEKVFAEASASKHQYGWIGIDRLGNWVMCCTTDSMACRAIGGDDSGMIAG